MSMNRTNMFARLRWIVIIGIAALPPGKLSAETREEWIALGTRVHGGFGSYIPAGIRIGLDAFDRLHAKPREVSVTFYDSDKAPCACLADGIAIATMATVGHRSLHIAPEKAPQGALAAIVIKHKSTGAALRYTVSEEWLSKLAAINKSFDPQGRYEEIMKAEGLFTVAQEN
jgi:formylmethanofuran dehydrogenase subunit E